MALGTILTIIIYALVIYIIFKIVKTLAKAFFYAGLVTLLVLLVFGFFIVKDVIDFRENFIEQSSIVLLEDNGNILTGYTMKPSPTFLTEGKISEYNDYLENQDYGKILNNKYRLMIIKLDLVSDLKSERISLGEPSLKTETVRDILKSNEPYEELNKALLEEEDSPAAAFDVRLKDDDLRIKAALLGTIVDEELLGTENAINFFTQYKKGNIIIYPETALFKFVKLLPLELVKKVAKKAFTKAKDEVTGGIYLKIEKAFSTNE